VKQIANFCSSCGGKIELAIPEGEVEWRHVCTKCGGITYYNPKMVPAPSYGVPFTIKHLTPLDKVDYRDKLRCKSWGAGGGHRRHFTSPNDSFLSS
jgi:rRNA maturation protein Nop10